MLEANDTRRGAEERLGAAGGSLSFLLLLLARSAGLIVLLSLGRVQAPGGRSQVSLSRSVSRIPTTVAFKLGAFDMFDRFGAAVGAEVGRWPGTGTGTGRWTHPTEGRLGWAGLCPTTHLCNGASFLQSSSHSKLSTCVM